MHILQTETGGNRHRIVDQNRPAWDTRHPLARIVERQARAGVMGGQQCHRIGAVGDRHTKGRGDGIGRNIVMCWPNPARSEHMVILAPQIVHSTDDCGVVIRHNPGFGQGNARLGQFTGQIMQVGIAGATRQNLISDHQHGSSWVGHDRSFFGALIRV